VRLLAALVVVGVSAAVVGVALARSGDGLHPPGGGATDVGAGAQRAHSPPRAADRPAPPVAEQPQAPWGRRAAEAHATLLTEFANTGKEGWPGLFRLRAPARVTDRLRWTYWWQAHALDALVDAHERVPSDATLRRIRALVRGVQAANGGRIANDYYDDMAWMALALLRADAHGAETIGLVRSLWRELRGGWSEANGGGIAWRRSQPRYKNVPANGPAAILAARLYARDGRPEDLRWARRIVAWMHDTLVDGETGEVWDGIDRRGDGAIDRRWQFTYNYGVVLGADLALHDATGEAGLVERARRTAHAGLDRLAVDGVPPDEGPGDGALFKGVFGRYLAELDDDRAREALRRSGEAAWAARDGAGRFGPSWTRAPDGPVELSSHLSGVMLAERLAAAERG